MGLLKHVNTKNKLECRFLKNSFEISKNKNC